MPGQRIPLLWETRPAAEVSAPVVAGTRVLLDMDALWDATDLANVGEILAVYGQNGSGWRVLHDYRAQGSDSFCLVGTDPRGRERHLPIDAAKVRVEVV